MKQKNDFKCELCGSTKNTTVQKVIRNAAYGNYINFDIDLCKNCCLLQLNKFLSEVKTKEYYERDYLNETYNFKIPPVEFVEDQKRRGKLVFQFLKRNKILYSKPISELDIVDVGCGSGGTLDYFVGKTNTISGVDPIIESVALAKKNGYDVKQGFIENLTLEDQSVDLIILLGTIEHAYNLNKAIEECKRVLREQGKIFIRWRSDKLWGSPLEYFNSNHYRYFNDQSIKYISKKHSLKIVLRTNEEIEEKPGAEYLILEKNSSYRPKIKIDNSAYKKIEKKLADYEIKYFKKSIDFLMYLRRQNFNITAARNYLNTKSNKLRSLSLDDAHVNRAIIEAREYVKYFVECKSSRYENLV